MNGVQRPKAPFKYHAMWSSHPDCKRLVSEIWNQPQVGCPMQVLKQKLKNLISALKSWNNEVFGNIHQNCDRAMQQVVAIHSRIELEVLNDELVRLDFKAQKDLHEALAYEEAFWKEKSRLDWLTLGDRNSAFYRMTKIKRATKSISTIKYGDVMLHSRSYSATHCPILLKFICFWQWLPNKLINLSFNSETCF